MNTPPDPLDPLFRWSRAARQAPATETPPPGFATRVLAEIRAPVERDWLLWLLPRAVAAAAIITLAGLIPGIGARPEPPEAELATLMFESALPSQP